MRLWGVVRKTRQFVGDLHLQDEHGYLLRRRNGRRFELDPSLHQERDAHLDGSRDDVQALDRCVLTGRDVLLDVLPRESLQTSVAPLREVSFGDAAQALDEIAAVVVRRQDDW